MDKKKKDIILLIVLTAFLVNYIIYYYIVDNRLYSLRQKQNKYIELEEKINNLVQLSNKEQQLKKEIDLLSEQTRSIEKNIPYNIDTPQLLYDFYNYCKNHNVKGDNIEFQLDNTQNNTESNENITNSLAINTSNQNSNLTVNNVSHNNKTESNKLEIKKLNIILRVYSPRNQLDEFLKDLDKVTQRKLNISSIKISSGENSAENNLDDAVNSKNMIAVEVVFYQYIFYDGTEHKNENSYPFFNIKTGFDSISDMIKDTDA